MDADLFGTPAAPESPFDRLVRRLEGTRSLPVPGLGTPPFVLGPPGPVIQDPDGVGVPATDVVMTPGRVYVTLEVPGASRETIQVEAEADVLRVAARKADGRAFRSHVRLPEPVDPAGIEATCRNGVLDITLPRRTGTDSRQPGGGPDGE